MTLEQTINTWVVAALRFAQTDECRRLPGPTALNDLENFQAGWIS